MTRMFFIPLGHDESPFYMPFYYREIGIDRGFLSADSWVPISRSFLQQYHLIKGKDRLLVAKRSRLLIAICFLIAFSVSTSLFFAYHECVKAIEMSHFPTTGLLLTTIAFLFCFIGYKVISRHFPLANIVFDGAKKEYYQKGLTFFDRQNEPIPWAEIKALQMINNRSGAEINLIQKDGRRTHVIWGKVETIYEYALKLSDFLSVPIFRGVNSISVNRPHKKLLSDRRDTTEYWSEDSILMRIHRDLSFSHVTMYDYTAILGELLDQYVQEVAKSDFIYSPEQERTIFWLLEIDSQVCQFILLQRSDMSDHVIQEKMNTSVDVLQKCLKKEISKQSEFYQHYVSIKLPTISFKFSAFILIFSLCIMWLTYNNYHDLQVDGYLIIKHNEIYGIWAYFYILFTAMVSISLMSIVFLSGFIRLRQ